MRSRDKRILLQTGLVLGAVGGAAAGGVLYVRNNWETIKTKISELIEKYNDKTRTAVAAAKDRKAALEKEQKQLKKDQKKLDKKVKKQRQKEAQRVYEEYLANGYEPTAEMIHQSGVDVAKLRQETEAKKAELQEASDARVEAAVQKAQEKRESKALKAEEKKAKVQLKDGRSINVSSTVRPEDLEPLKK